MRRSPHMTIHDPDKIGNVAQECFPQEVSKMTVEFWGDLINAVDISKYPKATQERIVDARKKLKKRKEYNEKIENIRQDFFNYLNSLNVPLLLGWHGVRKIRKICKEEYAEAFREDGYDLPPYLEKEFINDYIRDILHTGVVFSAWKKEYWESRKKQASTVEEGGQS